MASRLSVVLRALPAGVVVIDGRGLVQESNPVAVELLGEPLQGELWLNVLQRSFTSNSQGNEVQLTSGRMVSISTCPLGDEPGQIFHFVHVTENRVLQVALDRYKRLSAMGDMTAKLAHQVRTPLSAALLYTSHLAKGGLDEASERKFANKAMSRLKHLEKVVEDMLAFTRGSGQNRETLSLEGLLEAFHRNCESRMDEADGDLEISNDVDDLSLLLNTDAILSVMQNLVDNAVQVCDGHANIQIHTRLVTEHSGLPSVDLVFTDNGPGISEENLKQIFEPYFTTRAQGTGLGLAIARSVIEGHGGSLWVESTGDQGTTFVIRLPIHREITEEDHSSSNA
jgi:two-component system sensor histidine kinase FlrB